jgi:hypothetical protein
MRILFFSFLFFTSSLFAQTSDILTIRKYRQVNEHRIMKDYFNFLSIPNVASDTTSLIKNAYFISDKLKTIGVKQVQMLYPSTKGIPPAVYGEINVPGATKTIIFYFH